MGIQTALCSDTRVPPSLVQSCPCHIRAIQALYPFQARVTEVKRFVAAEHRLRSDSLRSRGKLAGVLLVS